MLPIRDNIPSTTTPFVNYALIGLCAAVFALQLRQPEDDDSMIERYGMIPARVFDRSREPGEPIQIEHLERVRTPEGLALVKVMRPAAESAVPPALTLLTCIFLHGGWLHFLGNVWVLWIFGDNVEDRFGHLSYLFFYLFAGVVASASHGLIDPGSTAPTIGASGAIAGVMGAYMVLYPHARVLTLIPIIFFFQMVVLPAPFFLGIWFLMQFLQGAFSITSAAAAGVAWWAHIGGFAVGAIVALLARGAGLLRPPVQEIRPGSERMAGYRVYPRQRW